MEEEIEESIVQKKVPVPLTGTPFILYIFLVFNLVAGIYVRQGQIT